MIKWVSFATMSQQYKTINGFIEDQNKVDKPVFDKLALRDLNDVFAQKLFYDAPATIKYCGDGYYKTIECEINKLEMSENGKKVLLSTDISQGVTKGNFACNLNFKYNISLMIN
ncbi:YolD-like family protein [Mammaliicoccus sciuri]|uniref:YolD-like family protein n=1 Tax=Mammaliicoccus sciuri TaxID=1296 RepID=UPI002DC05A9F|nr:YolD-like family protein [Mammaliicoccus sciuri]MEB8262962.1 YolD-like family protein [Mammaliicoccus sciuri]